MAPPYGIPPAGYRLPDETRVGGVHLQVAALDRSIDYYTRTLGLRVLSSGGGRAALGPQADQRALVSLYERPGVTAVPRRGMFGLYHFAILLPDRPSLGRFAAHLAATNTPIGMADHLVSEALYLHDPDGLGIEVYADRPRQSWQHAGRELAMASDPLDIRGLIAAGGGDAWTGAPAGTSMGHVHLHVGDLLQAEAYYHQGLGLDKMVWSYPGALFLAAGGYHHHLGTNTWSPGPSARDDQARLLEWEIVVPKAADTADAAASLSAAGFDASPDADDWVTRDPWGTRLRVKPAKGND